MKKVVLAGLVSALLLTGCGSTPDAVVDKMKQVDVTVCNNESDMLQVKDKIGEASSEKWQVIPEHQKMLTDLQGMLKKIWLGEQKGCKLLSDGESDREVEKSLFRWSKVTEYDPDTEEYGNNTEKVTYHVLFSTTENRKKFLEQMESIGFSGITAQVDSYGKKKSRSEIFSNHGVSFQLTKEKNEPDFYNSITIMISQEFVMMPPSLQSFVTEELLSAYQISRMTTEGKVQTIQFSSFDTDEDSYRRGKYYIMDQKLLQAELYVNVPKYYSDTGYIKKADDYKIFDLPEREKTAVVKTFMMLGASKEQAEAAVKELETQQSYKGTAGDVHWYYDRTENGSLNEEWRLRIE